MLGSLYRPVESLQKKRAVVQKDPFETSVVHGAEFTLIPTDEEPFDKKVGLLEQLLSQLY